MAQIIKEWDCKDSSVSALIDGYYSSVLVDKQEAEFDSMLHSDMTSESIALVLAAKSNIGLRESDIATNCPGVNVEVQHKLKKTTENEAVRINYYHILEEARKELKGLLEAGLICSIPASQ